MPVLTIPHLVEEGATRFGPLEAIVDGERRVDFRELRELMLDTAAAFVAAYGLRGAKAWSSLERPGLATWPYTSSVPT